MRMILTTTVIMEDRLIDLSFLNRVQSPPYLKPNGTHNTLSQSYFVGCSINPVSPRHIQYLQTPSRRLHFHAEVKIGYVLITVLCSKVSWMALLNLPLAKEV